MFLTIFSTKFVVKCATGILKIGLKKKDLMCKSILNRNFL